MLFQWPRRSDRELLDAYRQVEDPVYVEERDNRYRTFRRVVRMLGEPGGRTLLDVGAYCGYFVDVARESGFRAEGIELSRWAAKEARALGLTVHEQTLAERAADGSRYQIITLWDVVEHFADPRAELMAAFRLLEAGGMLYLSTIDAGSLAARLLGARWPWLMDMHLFYFDRNTLASLLASVGFQVVRTRAYTHVVSADYLLRKLAASWRPTRALFASLRRIVPGQVPVPVNLGDNMVMIARKP
jgi:2-polyprenyl-3-methyl-5-hydroxy-6-metoxy-1,4-benzoquinol methylase